MPLPCWGVSKSGAGSVAAAWPTIVQLTRSREWRIGSAGTLVKLDATR